MGSKKISGETVVRGRGGGRFIKMLVTQKNVPDRPHLIISGSVPNINVYMWAEITQILNMSKMSTA